MSLDDQQQAELLDQYTVALQRDPRALPPGDLAPELIPLARQLRQHTTDAEPSAKFATHLRQQIDTRAQHTWQSQAATPRRWGFPSFPWQMRWWSLGGLGALLTVITLVAAQFLTLQPGQVSAAEILQKAQTAAKDTSIRSFALTETLESAGVPGQNGGFRNVTRRWYEAPNRWRIESMYTMPGQSQTTHTATQVSDGTTRWDYDTQQNTVTIDRVDAGQDGQAGLTAFGVTGLEAALAEAGRCRAATLQPDANAAGRRAYVVELGESTCGSNAAPELNGRQVLWIDQTTFFVLKAELYGSNSAQPIATREITALEYNTALDARQFSFEPPASATVQDVRK
jgi:outer membrane lipoprotein-sorting protein